MYSYEDRVRAVRLYIKLGHRIAATRRQLGYAAKNSLLAWYAEYVQQQDLRRGYQRTKWMYDDEEKQRAVSHYLEHGQCLAYTIRTLGYPTRETLNGWIAELRPDFRKNVVGRSCSVPRSLPEKQQAVIALHTRKGAGREVATAVGVSRTTLYNWGTQLLGETPPRSMSIKKPRSLDAERDALTEEVAQLEARVRKLRLEHDILNKANELLKKDQGIDPLQLTSREKSQLVDALRTTHRLDDILTELQLARSTYFYNRLRSLLPEKYAQTRETIAEIFHGNYGCYGYRRVDGTLRRAGIRMSEKVVRRLMSEQGLFVRCRRRRRFTTYAADPSPAVENLVARNFHAAAPNTKWLTDLTEVQIPAGKIYISPIIDCFDGLVVSWTIGTRPDSQLVNTMLEQAIETLRPGEHPIIHSDRGAHYRWPEWISLTRQAKLTRSMSKKACSPDNAACEGFFGRLKTEFVYPRDWQDVQLDEFMRQIDVYIRWYNEKRIKVSLERRSPIEHRQALGLLPA
jgi:putative transposase